MSNRFSIRMKKKILGSTCNLVSFDEPYGVMASLLRDFKITGVMDAGASNGRISRKLLRNFPDANAYAFEPNPLYREILKEYADKEPRFHPQFVALSDHDGFADLHITESPGSTSLFSPDKFLEQIDPKGSAIKNTERVEVVTIDHWAAEKGNLKIQMMKFDIQGGELKALQGSVKLLQDSVLLIYVEVLFNPLYKEGAIFSEIDLFLRKYEFVLYDIFKPKYDPSGLLLWANAIFVHPRVLAK